MRIPLKNVHLSHTNTSLNADFLSPVTKKSVQLSDPVEKTSFSEILATSTPATKNIKTICNEGEDGENEANFSDILKPTSIHLLTPQKLNDYDIKNDSKDAVHVLNKLSLNDLSVHSKTDAEQISFRNAIESNQSNILCCDNSKALINLSLKDNETPTKNSIKEQNESANIVLPENKENISERNESLVPKITFRKRIKFNDVPMKNVRQPLVKNIQETLHRQRVTFNDEPEKNVRETLHRQRVTFNDEPEKNVRETLRKQRVTFGDEPKKNVGFTELSDVHDLTNRTIELSHNASQQLLIIKSGKWRRTIYDIRKSKLACKFLNRGRTFET